MKKNIEIRLDDKEIREIETALGVFEQHPESDGIKILDGAYVLSRVAETAARQTEPSSFMGRACLDNAGSIPHAKPEPVSGEADPTAAAVARIFCVEIDADDCVNARYEGDFPIGDFIEDAGDDIRLER